jgi:hypothetical protein
MEEWREGIEKEKGEVGKRRDEWTQVLVRIGNMESNANHAGLLVSGDPEQLAWWRGYEAALGDVQRLMRGEVDGKGGSDCDSGRDSGSGGCVPLEFVCD